MRYPEGLFMSESQNRFRNNNVWWLDPTYIVLCFLLPVYVSIWVAGELTNGGLSNAKGFFFLTGEIAWLGLSGILVLGFGTLSPIKPLSGSNIAHNINYKVLSFIGVATLIGYLYWFKDFIIRPQQILSLISSSSSVTFAIKGNLERQAGIASLAQLGLPFIIGYCYMIWAQKHENIPKYLSYMFIVILLSILFRSFAWAERVAIIEAGVAIGFIWITFNQQHGRFPRFIFNFFPIIATATVVALFSLGEYFRSWLSFYSKKQDSFVDFIFQRLANYYFNALNTGAGRLSMFDWPTYSFEWTLRWLHKFPVFGPIFSYYTDLKYSDDFLVRYGDPEFNNPSGIFSLFYDLGVFYGFCLLVVMGGVARYVFEFWRLGRSINGVWYFIPLMTFLEFFRYLYFGDARVFMVVFGLALLALSSKSVNHE